MQKYRTAFGAFVLSLTLLTSMYAQSPVKKNGALRVEGNQVVNHQGVPPQLRGISLSWSVWGGRKYYNAEVVDWLCRDFNINLLRASMAVQPDSGYLKDPVNQKSLITGVVDRAIKRGIYVLIDWHDHNAEQHLKESKEFFKTMAQRYAGTPNVIYEIWNEPERQDWPTIKAYSEEIIREIRAQDSENLIIVGSPHWDQDVDVAAQDPIKGYKNIAYSFHFYASESSHDQRLQKKAELAQEKGLALMVTEWGVGEASGDGKFDRQRTQNWMDWMEKNKLSWVNWNITDKRETTAVLNPGASASGGWKEQDLTPAGQYIRAVLRSHSTRKQ
ncbi:glycoside hydrolase family 5 protein [Siphonobacter sp. SORGH_AS_1065]|uniref:glycoside hydrolase family 5 protein n=1 Tax=Siphonobacter sp. SORGH_AS_1065 TaxID=3041795 RepID=UPI002786D511|nr:glycoside hydrolase family 5 protein [Siphonobacter sp. SORGH_AS_1065]MDQ1089897.1 endoglucanase [Siphonobacter sp. SORGH_AS_1065]